MVKPGELPLPGMGLDELVAKGVLFGICNVALTVYSGMFAKQTGMQAEAVKQDWVAGLLPGVQVVPSGVIAVNRTQERGCTYCFAG
jgi:intracellular sulfur oxidation DsrE/DsrF family protein